MLRRMRARPTLKPRVRRVALMGAPSGGYGALVPLSVERLAIPPATDPLPPAAARREAPQLPAGLELGRSRVLLLPIVRDRGGVDRAEPAALAQVREAAQDAAALVLDLDKTLVRGHAGTPVLLDLVRRGGLRLRWGFLRLIFHAIRCRWSCSSLGFLLPRAWRLDGEGFEHISLSLEFLVTPEEFSAAYVRCAAEIDATLRPDLVQICSEFLERGRPVILATANSRTHAERVAERVGIPVVVASALDRRTGETRVAIGPTKRALVDAELRRRSVRPEDALMIADLDWSRADLPLLTDVGTAVVIVNDAATKRMLEGEL